MFQAIEEFNTFTSLGIRFWDPAFDRQICNDLIVTASPQNAPQMKSYACRTKSDVYAFSHLYSMRDVEYGFSDGIASPDLPRKYIVEVKDSAGRYINVAFPVELPLSYPGVFLTNEIASPSAQTAKGVYLFSSANRTAPSWMAVVRGELIDQDSELPASYAVLRVSSESGDVWYGVADELGRYEVMFPYPVLVEGFGASPTTPGHNPLYKQTWDLNLEVLYSPNTLVVLPGTSIPNYLSILKQSQASIWSQSESNGGVPSISLPLLLEFHRPVISRTEGLSFLLVSVTDTSP